MTTPARKRSNGAGKHLLSAATITFLATLLGAQSHAALVIPPNPLQSGTPVAPNILFILDDSGSMAEDEMLNQDVTRIRTSSSNGARLDLSSVGSPVNGSDSDDRHYASTYNTLYYNPRTTYYPWKRADKSYTAAVSPTSTYTDDNLAVSVPGRTGAGATAESAKSSIQGSRRKFYVPNDGITDLGDLNQYTYYELTDASNARKCVPGKDGSNNWRWTCSAVTSFTWTTTDGSVTRTIADEWQNYATWYGYHRTRMKVAKAGASYAFSDLGENYRVGYRSIWQRRGFDIPVGTAGGLFKDVTTGTTSENRTTWFDRLFSAQGNNGTPLQGALQNAGEYFKQTGDTGPWSSGTAGEEQLACRQNFAILTTDGYWNDQSNFNNVGNVDNTAKAAITGPNGRTFTYNNVAPYADSNSNTLGDIAMKYWNTDLRTDLDNIVPSSTANPAFWQHMVTFGISIGLKGLLQESDRAALTAGTLSWGDPSGTNDKPEKIDDLLHASMNSRGKFVAATDPNAFTTGLRSALASIAEAVGSASSVSFNGSTLNTNSRSYVASFVSGQWTGDVKSYAVTQSGVSTTALWNAAAGIPATRTILTFGSNGQVPSTFPTTAQETVLTTAIANYIKGNRAGEGTTYRTRSSIFGDIVHSSPVYVKEGSTETIYVGANDGMLHAIDATNGQELWTYVPGLLDMAQLKELSRNIDFVHKFFVDGPIVVSTRTQTPNKNILIGTLGRGGKGVFGLDVTTPGTFNTTGRAWEYAGDADMGQVLGRPLIVKLNDTAGSTGVLVPNGINSTNDKAALFVLNAATGALLKKITTNNETANGLSMPTALDVDGNGTADYVYAGDQQGNVWKFNLTSSDATTWSATKLFTATHSTTVAGVTTTKRQPISGGVTVAYSPTSYAPWVLFGTGRYITETDPADRSVQSWYGLEDTGTAITDRTSLKQRQIKVAGVINSQTYRAFEEPVAGDMANKRGWVVDLLMPPNSTAEGERMIGDQFVIAGNVLIASSVIPGSSGCSVGGTGYLNYIDAFTGGAVSKPFIDANGDGLFNSEDELPSDADGDGTNDGTTPTGSAGMDIGMISDAVVGLPGLGGSGGGISTPIICVNGAVGMPGCKRFDWGPGWGRVSWREALKD